MSHFSGHFEGALTFLTPFVPQKKIMSRSFLNSGTLIVKIAHRYMNIGFRTEAALFPEKEYIMEISFAVLHRIRTVLPKSKIFRCDVQSCTLSLIYSICLD
jgi:hypothetical protein